MRRDYYLALEDDEVVRAGFCLKREEFLLDGEAVTLASFQGPVSEGLVNPAYGMLAFRLFRDMEAMQPNLFAWGPTERVMELMLRLKWRQFFMPLQVKVLNAGRFLRESTYLRGSPRNRIALDALAVTGLGAMGLHLGQGLLAAHAAGQAGIDASEVASFGPWADEVWQVASPAYRLIARRDATNLNALLPHGAWPHATILRMARGDEVVGWAAIRDTQFADDRRFGPQKVGTVLDALARPGYEAAVLSQASIALRRRGVDAIVSNFTHPIWTAAFGAAGFFSIRGRRPLLFAPAAMATIKDDAVVTDGLHLTPLDGDGPLGL
ncbi:hypothetical protein [uncultured Phenylobacterium sp.]|uniref:hypothetical protein n=1 Tax=uncultured Phenylobacterium sp. TaxID=349273 RepID=UPI0025DC1AFF|nr:hypothetical protein [uncultured Phenylobacterium sp.]